MGPAPAMVGIRRMTAAMIGISTPKLPALLEAGQNHKFS
jgi:hypothetical protein